MNKWATSSGSYTYTFTGNGQTLWYGFACPANQTIRMDNIRLTKVVDHGYEAVVVRTADYYPFGMVMPGRNKEYVAGKYRFGYNGMEMDNEVSGNGNSYTTEFRQYDPRLGRWKSLDPLMAQFPWMSPYVAFDNNPIFYIDPFGLEGTNPEGLPDNPCEGDVRTADNGKDYEYIITDGGEGVWAQKFESLDVVADRCLYIFVSNSMGILEGAHHSGSLYSADITISITGARKSGAFEAIVNEFREFLDCKGYTPPIASVNKTSMYEGLHNALDWLGMIPVVGEVFDAVNALIYAAEGDFVNAGISSAAIIPIFGSVSTGARQVKKVVSEVILETEERVIRDVGQDMAEPVVMRGGGGGTIKGGGKNAKHANQSAKSSSLQKYEQAKLEFDALKSKPNKTPADKEKLKKLEKEVKHWKQKADWGGEDHSRNAKGNR